MHQSACGAYLAAVVQANTYDDGDWTKGDQQYISFGSKQFKQAAQECALEPINIPWGQIITYSLDATVCVAGASTGLIEACFPLYMQFTKDQWTNMVENDKALNDTEKSNLKNDMAVSTIFIDAISINGNVVKGDEAYRITSRVNDIYSTATDSYEIIESRKIVNVETGIPEAMVEQITLNNGNHYIHVIKTDQTNTLKIQPYIPLNGNSPIILNKPSKNKILSMPQNNFPSQIDIDIYNSSNLHAGRHQTRYDSLDTQINEVFHSGLATQYQSAVIVYPNDSYKITVTGDSTFSGDINLILQNYKGNSLIKDSTISISLAPNKHFTFNLNCSKGTITDIQTNSTSIPTTFMLNQNFPNPFNPTTTINYSVAKSVIVKIKVYDVLGREVTTLVNENKPVGNYSVKFDASRLVSGVYFYRMQAGEFIQTKKLIYLK